MRNGRHHLLQLTSADVARERLFAERHRLGLLLDLCDTADACLLEDGAHGAGGGLAVVERRRDRRVRVVHAVVELLLVRHAHRLVLQLLDVVEDGVDDVIDLGERAGAAALREQRFGDGRQLVIAEQLHLLDLLVGDGVEELAGVHLGAEEQRLVKVPGARHAGQQVIADARADLAERVGVQRGDDEDVRPLHQLQVQALFVEAFGDLPLALVGENLRHRADLVDIDEVLRPLRQHHSNLQTRKLEWWKNR